MNPRQAIDVFFASGRHMQRYSTGDTVFALDALLCFQTGNPRARFTYEIMVVDVNPDDAVAMLRAHGMDAKSHVLTAFCAPSVDMTSRYAELGYKPYARERLMVCPLTAETGAEPIGNIHRAATPAEVEVANERRGRNWIDADELSDAALYNYWWEQEGRPVAFAKLDHVVEGATYLSDMHTRQEHRRQGIGTRFLRSIHALWSGRCEYSVLISVEPAYAFYERCGYQAVQEIQMFVPQSWERR